MSNEKKTAGAEYDLTNEADVKDCISQVRGVTGLLVDAIAQLTGGGGNALLTCAAIGHYGQLQIERATAAGEECAGYAMMRDRMLAEIDDVFAKLPALTPEVIAKAKEIGATDYRQARMALDAEKAEAARNFDPATAS